MIIICYIRAKIGQKSKLWDGSKRTCFFVRLKGYATPIWGPGSGEGSRDIVLLLFSVNKIMHVSMAPSKSIPDRIKEAAEYILFSPSGSGDRGDIDEITEIGEKRKREGQHAGEIAAAF